MDLAVIISLSVAAAAIANAASAIANAVCAWLKERRERLLLPLELEERELRILKLRREAASVSTQEVSQLTWLDEHAAAVEAVILRDDALKVLVQVLSARFDGVALDPRMLEEAVLKHRTLADTVEREQNRLGVNFEKPSASGK